MRPAVDRVHQRPAPRRIEVRRQDQPDLDRVAAVALDRQLAHLAQRVAREHCPVERLERTLAAAVGPRREQRRRVQVARTIERQHAAVAPTAQNPPTVPPATRSDGSAASSFCCQTPTRPRSSTQKSSAALSGRHARCVVARSNAGASRADAAGLAVEQRHAALVVERALGVVGMERDRPAVGRIPRMRVGGVRRRGQHALAARTRARRRRCRSGSSSPARARGRR